jgi:hypothetical protein
MMTSTATGDMPPAIILRPVDRDNWRAVVAL